MVLAQLEVLDLPLRDPFVIGRPADSETRARTVIVEVRDSRFPGLVGLGEGFPDAYYGETAATIGAVMPLLIDAVGQPEYTLGGLAEAAAAMTTRIRNHGSAKCALDIALHDLAAQIAGRSFREFIGLPDACPPTDFTLGIGRPDVVAERAQRVDWFPALKIKLGKDSDLDTLEAVRAAFSGPLRVDANTGWDEAHATRLLPHLERLGVELIEQPFAAHRLDQLGWLQAKTSIPVVADESVITIDDLPGLVGIVAGVNVKLAKCGGVGPALRMLQRARDLGFRTFLGCMQETSIGIAASASVGALADWVDLDGCLLLAADPFVGLDLGPDARWRLPAGPGLGLQRRPA